ncbi:MAG: hypothetical protein B7Z53_02095 [Rhodospirillales bacterium 12-71-4]|nr:MAG: hypothetical protein B7Z53_02095 [Rhodospirillales bacterium 12-71-4]
MSLPLLQAVLARNPEDPDVLVYIALAQRRLGRPELAMDAYLRALAASPNHPAALAYQGSLYLEMGERWRAEANYLQLTFSCGTCAEATTLARELAAAPR